MFSKVNFFISLGFAVLMMTLAGCGADTTPVPTANPTPTRSGSPVPTYDPKIPIDMAPPLPVWTVPLTATPVYMPPSSSSAKTLIHIVVDMNARPGCRDERKEDVEAIYHIVKFLDEYYTASGIDKPNMKVSYFSASLDDAGNQEGQKLWSVWQNLDSAKNGVPTPKINNLKNIAQVFNNHAGISDNVIIVFVTDGVFPRTLLYVSADNMTATPDAYKSYETYLDRQKTTFQAIRDIGKKANINVVLSCDIPYDDSKYKYSFWGYDPSDDYDWWAGRKMEGHIKELLHWYPDATSVGKKVFDLARLLLVDNGLWPYHLGEGQGNIYVAHESGYYDVLAQSNTQPSYSHTYQEYVGDGQIPVAFHPLTSDVNFGIYATQLKDYRYQNLNKVFSFTTDTSTLDDRRFFSSTISYLFDGCDSKNEYISLDKVGSGIKILWWQANLVSDYSSIVASPVDATLVYTGDIFLESGTVADMLSFEISDPNAILKSNCYQVRLDINGWRFDAGLSGPGTLNFLVPYNYDQMGAKNTQPIPYKLSLYAGGLFVKDVVSGNIQLSLMPTLKLGEMLCDKKTCDFVVLWGDPDNWISNYRYTLSRAHCGATTPDQNPTPTLALKPNVTSNGPRTEVKRQNSNRDEYWVYSVYCESATGARVENLEIGDDILDNLGVSIKCFAIIDFDPYRLCKKVNP